ncbi:helix-turn-helix domain-containing protein, partial [Pasteurella multocida]
YFRDLKMEKALTIKEVADRLNMSVSAVRNQIYNWNFFKMKGCRGWRILESDLAKHKEWSNNNNRLALSVDDKEILCRSTKEKEMARGGLISHRQTVKELDDLLDRM